MAEPGGVVEVSDVELRRGGRRLITGLSFSLMPGQLALVTGPNGSGKTTLLRALAGLSRPERGDILIDGRAAATLDPAERAGVAYQAHLEGLKKDLTIDENIRFISEIRNFSEDYSGILSALGIDALRGQPVARLSAGQKRRVVLACLKVSRARLWLLDEPLTNLDQAGRELVASWLDQHLGDGGSAVVATHLSAALTRPGSLLVEL